VKINGALASPSISANMDEIKKSVTDALLEKAKSKVGQKILKLLGN
jgi:hypothetical protein